MKKFNPDTSVTKVKSIITIYLHTDVVHRLDKVSIALDIKRNSLVNQMINHCLNEMEETVNEDDTQ